MAAYPPDGADLTTAELKAVSLRAENDMVADPAKVDGRAEAPARRSSKLVQIDGAVHSFFGRYGPQAGDGVPTCRRGQPPRSPDHSTAIAAFLADL